MWKHRKQEVIDVITKTLQFKLLPTKEQEDLLIATLESYISSVNTCVDWMYMFDSYGRLTSHNVPGDMPSALKNQAIRDAKSIFRKFKQGKVQTLPVLKKPVAVWNSQNFKITDSTVSIPVWQSNKSVRICVKAVIPDSAKSMLSAQKLGSLRITRKSNKWVAQIAYDVPDADPVIGDGTMGVDLGIKCPAVCYTDSGKVRFFGNGRKNRTIRRRFYTRRKTLGKLKKPGAIRNAKNKEQRIMRDTDHKLSRQIINFAKEQHIAVIKLEKLQNIRKNCTTRKSRKNNRSLNSWSFYRLASFIEYKAAESGISVIYVDPAYTSKICPVCGTVNKADDRDYRCACGFHSHRDIVGARNILSA